MFEKIKEWKFLNESGMQWAIFVGVMILIFFAWSKIIGYMKAAV